MRIGCVNIEGIRGKIGNEGVEKLLEKVDILGGLETWVEKDLDIKIPGFQVVATKRAVRRTRMGRAAGGMVILVRDEWGSLPALLT